MIVCIAASWSWRRLLNAALESSSAPILRFAAESSFVRRATDAAFWEELISADAVAMVGEMPSWAARTCGYIALAIEPMCLLCVTYLQPLYSVDERGDVISII